MTQLRWSFLLAAAMAVALACNRSSMPPAKSVMGRPEQTVATLPKPGKEAEERIATEPMFIHRDVPLLIQVLPGRLPDPSSVGDSSADWLELHVAKTGKIFQRLSYPWSGGLMEPQWAEAVDLDGDGYMDLQAPAALCATQGYYYAWRYNPKRRRFETIPGFQEIPSPEPDGKGRLHSWYRTGPDSGIETLYKWRKGRLVELGSREYANK